MLKISTFWVSTSKLLRAHMWSPEQWLGATDIHTELVGKYLHTPSRTKKGNLKRQNYFYAGALSNA